MSKPLLNNTMNCWYFPANIYFLNNFLQEQKQLGKTDLPSFFFQGVLKLVRNLVLCLSNTRPQTLSVTYPPSLTNINNIACIQGRTFKSPFRNRQSFYTETTPRTLSVWIHKHVTLQLQFDSAYQINHLTVLYSLRNSTFFQKHFLSVLQHTIILWWCRGRVLFFHWAVHKPDPRHSPAFILCLTV